MPFQPKEIQIFPKGLNLLPPGDVAAEGDCLRLDGFWPGSVGRLQQARGWVKKNQAADGVSLDSLCEASGKLFFGGGGNLYMGAQDGATVSALSCGGYFDGQPLGLAAYQGMVWVMNRSRQKRVATGAPAPNGSTPTAGTVYDWQVGTPPSAPDVTLGGGGSLDDGPHAYYVSLVDVYGYETSPSPAAQVTCPALPMPGFTAGAVACTVGSPDVVLSGATWGPEIDGQQFNVPSVFTTYTPPGAARYTISYVDATHGTLNANYAGATASGLAYIIYSLQNDPTGPYNSGKVTIQQPSIPPADAGIIASWNVYHQSPGLNGPYLVNAAPIPLATTSYVDYGDAAHSQDDSSLLAMGALMEAGHDPPPACMVMASQPYNGRLVVGNSAQYPNRIWWTNALQPSYFPGSANPQSGNWADIGNDTGDGILHISVRPGMLLVYRQRSIWRITGDLGDAASVIAPLIPNMGIVGQRAVVSTSAGDIAVVKQGQAFGIYRVTDWEQRISAKIEPLFTGVGSECYSPINAAATGRCALGYQLGRLWFSYPDGANTTPNRTLICDVEQDGFSVSVAGRWFAREGGFGAFLHGSLFFLGASGQRVYSLDDGLGDEDGGAVPLAYQSRYEDAGNPDHEKTWADLVINHNTQGENLTVNLKLNKGASTVALATINSSALTRQVIPIPSPDAFNAAVEIAGSGHAGASSFVPVVIDGPLILHYFLKPRKAMTWDSGPTDHGIAAVKLVDALEIDMDGGALTLFVQSDLPGGVMTERTAGGAGIAVAATTGRQVQRFILTDALSGRVYRYQAKASGATPFLIYRVRVRTLNVGVYVDGAVGDTWYTSPIAAGV